MAQRNYWFGHRWIGTGFAPASWQGWLCLLAYIVLLGWSLTAARNLMPDDHFARGGALALALVIAETAVFLTIVWAKRDKSRVVRWRWFGGR